MKIKFLLIILLLTCSLGWGESLQTKLDKAGPKPVFSNHEWVECPYCHNQYAKGEDEQYHICFQNKHLKRIEQEIKELREELTQ